MKIGVLIPHRSDRPAFLEQLKSMLRRQTLQPDEILFVDYPPISDDIDVTRRYYVGCIHLFITKEVDIVLFLEVDDWYSPNYIETMVSGWRLRGRPAIFGLDTTIYYHIFSRKWLQIRHRGRSSAFCTLVTKAALSINWPADSYPYLDVELWRQMPGVSITLKNPIAVGIKHGMGLVGGGAHNIDSPHYQYEDPKGDWLRSVTGEDYEFYERLRLNKTNYETIR